MAPRYGDRQGGYLRIVRTGFQKGDGAEKAFIELLGAEKQLDAKRQKRDEIKAKKRAELEKQLEEAKKEEPRAAKKPRRTAPLLRLPCFWSTDPHGHSLRRMPIFLRRLPINSQSTSQLSSWV